VSISSYSAVNQKKHDSGGGGGFLFSFMSCIEFPAFSYHFPNHEHAAMFPVVKVFKGRTLANYFEMVGVNFLHGECYIALLAKYFSCCQMHLTLSNYYVLWRS